jgi:predicted ArsR family transcriptional regulator
MDAEVLALLADGARAPEQIAAEVGVNVESVEQELQRLYQEGFVNSAVVRQQLAEPAAAASYWRITDAGSARLEQLWTEDAAPQ